MNDKGSPNVLTVMYGSHTFDRGSSRVSVVVMKQNGTGDKELPSTYLTKVSGGSREIPASTDGYAGHGKWYLDNYFSTPGRVIRIQAGNSSNGSPVADGIVLILLRDDAPLIRVRVNLRANRLATYNQLPVFVGRGDVLDLGEYEDHGVVFTERYLRNCANPEEIKELFEVDVLEAGTAKPTMVEVRRPDKSVTKVAVAPEPARRIRMRRG